MSLRPLFVTQVYEASLSGERGFADFNAELEDACRMLADEDVAGQAWGVFSLDRLARTPEFRQAAA